MRFLLVSGKIVRVVIRLRSIVFAVITVERPQLGRAYTEVAVTWQQRVVVSNCISAASNSSEGGGPISAKKHVRSMEGERPVATNSPVIPTPKLLCALPDG